MADHKHHHRLIVRRQVGSVTLDADLALKAPWTILFGPSGSGKSSLLRAAAGVLPSLQTSFTRGAESLSHLPAHQRRLAYAPQGAALFPHLTVRENVAFPASTVNSPLPQGEVIELFQLADLLTRKPHELSGGERQRVALARAFATPNAKLMLLDEPFTGFDRRLRDALLPKMRAWCAEQGLPVVSVTHDVDEALLLEAEVARLDAGRILAQGSAMEVLAEEREQMLVWLQ